MDGQDEQLAEAQRRHWQATYAARRGMYGDQLSDPAIHAAGVFRAARATDVLGLGAVHGRDALHLACCGFTVQPTDFSPTGLGQLRDAAEAVGLAERVSTAMRPVPICRTGEHASERGGSRSCLSFVAI